MERGIFLTEKGLKNAKLAFDVFANSNPLNDVSPPKTINQSIISSNSQTFDDLYLALYKMNLSGAKYACVPKKSQPNGLVHRTTILALLDITFPKIERHMSFEKTLIDEFSVVSIKRFKNAIFEIVPYPIIVKSFGIGCVWFEFSVLARPSKSKEISNLPWLEPKEIEKSPTWANLKDRFKVLDFTIYSG